MLGVDDPDDRTDVLARRARRAIRACSRRYGCPTVILTTCPTSVYNGTESRIDRVV